MHEQDRETILKDLLASIHKLIGDTRQQRVELKTLEADVEKCYASGEMTDFYYAVSQERLRRFHQNIDYCLRSLDHQKKITLTKLQELD